MLCSAPAQKSGLNWLDRLRFNKGIPTGDDLDLDSFLANHPNPTSSDSFHSVSKSTGPSKIRARTRSSEISAADGRPPLSSVLADLLNIGGCLTSGKKCPRKQTNPKLFVASSPSNSNTGIVDCARKDDNVPTTNSFIKDTAKLPEEGLDCCDVEEEEKENEVDELRGFSKSEVTVIDTSCPEWKADKSVFRKNNVWKVRERKGKSKSLSKKKNKGTLGFVNHKSAGVKKGPKFMDYQFGSNREESMTPST